MKLPITENAAKPRRLSIPALKFKNKQHISSRLLTQKGSTIISALWIIFYFLLPFFFAGPFVYPIFPACYPNHLPISRKKYQQRSRYLSGYDVFKQRTAKK